MKYKRKGIRNKVLYVKNEMEIKLNKISRSWNVLKWDREKMKNRLAVNAIYSSIFYIVRH